MLIDEVRPKRGVELVGIGPAHHLALELRIGQPVEKLAEAIDLVALGNDDINGKAHVEHALDDVKLLGDLAGFAGDIVSRILDKTVGGNNKKETVDRAIGTVFLKEIQKLLPLTLLAGFDLLEHEAAGGIEQHGVIGEPPIHVNGAADALKLVLHPGRETDIAVTNRFGLARAGFANDHVPGQGIKVLAARAILLDALLEFFAQIIQASASAGIRDRARRGRAMLLQFAAHPRGLFLALPGAPEEIRSDGQREENHKNC